MAEGTSVGSLYYDLNIDDKNLKSQLDGADKKVSGFGDKLHDGLNKAAAGFAVVGAGLTLISKNATDFTVELLKNSKALGQEIGTSTEEASRLVAAFGRMGVSAEQAAQVFGIFSKNISKATEDAKNHGLAQQKTQIEIDKTKASIASTQAVIAKSGDKTGELNLKLRDLNNTLASQQGALSATSNAFEKMGISTVNAQGQQKDFNTLLFEVADKFQGMPNGIDKTTLALELFGRSGRDMIKVLNLGSDGIKDLEAQADKLGITLTSSNIAKVNDFIQSQKDLKQSTDALKLAIGTTTAPVLTEFNKKLNDVILSLLGTDGPMKTLTVDFLAFSGPVFGAISGVLAFGASIAQIGSVIGFAALGAIALIVLAIVGFGVAIYEALTHMDELGAVVVTVMDKIQMWVKGVFDWISNNWPGLLNALVNPFGAAVGIIAAHVGSIGQTVKNAAGDAWHWLYSAGKDIINGLVRGIKDQVGDAVRAVEGVGKAVVKAARNALDWHSPSKVFVEAGRSISEGLALGIKRSTGQALSAMDALSNSVISPNLAFSPAGAGGAGSAGNSTSYGDTVVNIGEINNAQDEAYVLRRLDRNQSLESRGISPAV